MHLANDRKRQSHKILTLGSQNICALLENLARGLGESAAWVIIIVIIISLFKVD